MPNLQDSFWYHQSLTHVLAIWSWQASSKSFTITYKSVLDLTGVVHMDYCQLIMNTGIQWKVAARLISSMYNSEHHCWILYQGSVNSKYIATCVERCVRCIWSVVCQQNIITAVCLWVPMENCARRGVPGNLLLLSVISLYFWHLHIQLMGRL